MLFSNAMRRPKYSVIAGSFSAICLSINLNASSKVFGVSAALDELLLDLEQDAVSKNEANIKISRII